MDVIKLLAKEDPTVVDATMPHKRPKVQESPGLIAFNYSASQVRLLQSNGTVSNDVAMEKRTGRIFLYSEVRKDGPRRPYNNIERDRETSVRKDPLCSNWGDAVCFYRGVEEGVVDLVKNGQLTTEGKKYCKDRKLESTVDSVRQEVVIANPTITYTCL